MFHSQINWEDLDDDTTTTGNHWEDSSDYWGGIAIAGASTNYTNGLQLCPGESTNCGFLYVKNLGSTHNTLVSLNGDSHYYIVVPPNGSVSLRGSTNLQCNEIYVKSSHVKGTTIEYILAQLTP